MEDLYWKVDFNKKTCFLVGKYSKYSFLHKQHISFDITDDDCFSEVENVLYTTWNIKLLKDFRFFVPELIANDILNRFPYTKGCSHSGLYGIEKIVIDENDYIIKKNDDVFIKDYAWYGSGCSNRFVALICALIEGLGYKTHRCRSGYDNTIYLNVINSTTNRSNKIKYKWCCDYGNYSLFVSEKKFNKEEMKNYDCPHLTGI